MKTTFSSTHAVLVRNVILAILGGASLVSVARANDEAIIRREGETRYVSGGVGSESIEQLAAIAGDFNLKLVFALNSGEYLSAVRVVIADATGKRLLDTLADGPWFLAKLPAGTYRITATYAGKEHQRQISIGAEKLSTFDFRWAAL